MQEPATPEYVDYLEAQVEALRSEVEGWKERCIMLTQRIWDLEEEKGLRVALLRFGKDEPSSEE